MVKNLGTSSVISGINSGVKISGSTGTVTDNGTITGAKQRLFGIGRRGEREASAPRPPFRARSPGVYIAGGVGTVTNEGEDHNHPRVQHGRRSGPGRPGHQQRHRVRHLGQVDGVLLAATGTVTDNITGTSFAGVDLLSGGAVNNSGQASNIAGGRS